MLWILSTAAGDASQASQLWTNAAAYATIGGVLGSASGWLAGAAFNWNVAMCGRIGTATLGVGGILLALATGLNPTRADIALAVACISLVLVVIQFAHQRINPPSGESDTQPPDGATGAP